MGHGVDPDVILLEGVCGVSSSACTLGAPVRAVAVGPNGAWWCVRC